MSIVMKLTCARCRKAEDVELASVAEATALEKHQQESAVVLEQLENFVRALPKDKLPAYVGIVDGELIVHSHLCDGEDAKRSCARRVRDLAAGMGALEERKPRQKKAEKA